MKQYEAYKNSGIEWIGEIPEHWEVKRLKNTIIDCKNGLWGNDPDGNDDILCIRVADFIRDQRRVSLATPTFRAIRLDERKDSTTVTVRGKMW